MKNTIIPKDVKDAIRKRAVLIEKKKELEKKILEECALYDDIIFKYFDERNIRQSGFKFSGLKYKVTKVVTQRVKYDIEKIKKYIPRDILPLIINKSITIQNYDEFANYMKQISASPKVVKSFLSISETVNESELDKLYQKGKIDYDDIKKCASIEEGKPYLRFSTFNE